MKGDNNIDIIEDSYLITCKSPPFKREATKAELKFIRYVQKRLKEEKDVLSDDWVFYVRIENTSPNGSVIWDMVDGRRKLRRITLDFSVLDNINDAYFVFEHELAHAYDHEQHPSFLLNYILNFIISSIVIIGCTGFFLFALLLFFHISLSNLDKWGVSIISIIGAGSLFGFFPEFILREIASLFDLKQRINNQLNEFNADKRAYTKINYVYKKFSYLNSYTHPSYFLRIFNMKFFPLCLNLFKQDGIVYDKITNKILQLIEKTKVKIVQRSNL